MLVQLYSNISFTNAASQAMPFKLLFRRHIYEWSVAVSENH